MTNITMSWIDISLKKLKISHFRQSTENQTIRNTQQKKQLSEEEKRHRSEENKPKGEEMKLLRREKKIDLKEKNKESAEKKKENGENKRDENALKSGDRKMIFDFSKSYNYERERGFGPI